MGKREKRPAPVPQLSDIGARIRQKLVAKDAAREQGIRACREVIRYSAEAIRAMHRKEYEKAGSLLNSGKLRLEEAGRALADYGDLANSGFIHDAQKEYAEGNITLALITGKPVPGPEAVGVSYASYLNGMGEAVGELRRFLLDSMRNGDLSPCERILSDMDDIYDELIKMDFPDAITYGLRRTTDVVRGILEKTRGDLTLAIIQREIGNNKLRQTDTK
ncbi:MAG: haloacid dehalogenase [Dehalococcoidia bacterium]|nr:haloacid dehalogenase [Dehalococcoidia bacterium]